MSGEIHDPGYLLDDFGADAGPDGAPPFANGDAHALFHGDWLDQLDGHLDVVPRHHHLHALRQADGPGDIGGAHIELRAVAIEEGGVAPALLFAEHIDL